MILPIVEMPKDIEELCQPYEPLFSKPQFLQFERFITGLLITNKADIAALSEGYRMSQSYDRLHYFISESPWEINDVLEKTVSVIKHLPADRTFSADGMLILDDTLIEKYGKAMEGTGKLWDHSDGRWLEHAHNLAGLVYGNHKALRYPLQFKLYRKEKDCQNEGIAFKTKITLGQEMIDWATSQGILYQTVVFDSWFFCREMVDHIEGLGKDWISMSKSNRLIRLDNKKIQLGAYAKTLDPNSLPTVVVQRKTYRVKSMQAHFPCLKRGKETVRLVVCFEQEEYITDGGEKRKRWKEPVFLVSNRKDIRPERLIRCYQIRWSIETFYRDAKSELGFEDYQMRSLDGIKSHWCMVFTSAVLLELIRYQTCLEKGLKRTDISIGQLRQRAWGRSLRAIIIWTVSQYQQGVSPEQICMNLKI